MARRRAKGKEEKKRLLKKQEAPWREGKKQREKQTRRTRS